MLQWLEINTTEVAAVFISLVVLYSGVLLFTRVFGLRSFSKMSAADFAMTIAVGTILGGAIANPKPSIPVALLALAGLFGAQLLVATLRVRSAKAQSLFDNDPVYLVKEGEILWENMIRTGVSASDLRAKLREANAFSLANVAAVVFETTGDVSVLHGSGSTDDEGNSTVDDFILEDVKDRREHVK